MVKVRLSWKYPKCVKLVGKKENEYIPFDSQKIRNIVDKMDSTNSDPTIQHKERKKCLRLLFFDIIIIIIIRLNKKEE